jgi:hypothetical protein
LKTKFAVAVLALALTIPVQGQEESSVSLGLQVYALYQEASSSLDGRDDNAFGNINRFFGDWTVFKDDTGNLGTGQVCGRPVGIRPLFR